MPINFYVGDVGSFMGTTVSGITFSATGVAVNGVSGSAVALATTTKSGNSSYLGDDTPLVFINTFPSPGTNYTLPADQSPGTVIIVRRTDTAATGVTTLFAGQTSTQTIRAIGSSTNATSINIAASTFRCFFFAHNVWWEF